MRRRITAAFVAVLTVALILAGGVSLLLVRHAASNNAKTTLLGQASALAANPKTLELNGVLPLITSIGSINADGIFTTSAAGKIAGSLPPGIPSQELNGASLASGHSVAGSHSHLAFAAVPLFSAQGTTVVLWLESKERFSDDSIWYFLVATGISLLVAASISAVLTRRIARRVNTAAEAAKQIAGGDFATRIASEPGDYPELVGLNSSINAMAEDLARAQDGERQFLLSISHDLRTPLTSIRGYAEAIAERATPDLPRAAKVVVAEADRLERLIDDLLDLARLRARRFSFNLSKFSLVELVRTTTEALPLGITAEEVKLDLKVPDDRLEMLSDPHRIGQIVANLVENSLKFAKALVVIELSSQGEDEVQITVQDDGPGIAPEDLPNVFQRLYTSRRHPARSAGTGIGLAIVAELTEALGGSVAAHSPVADHAGSRLTVILPRVSVKQAELGQSALH